MATGGLQDGPLKELMVEAVQKAFARLGRTSIHEARALLAPKR